MTIEDEMDEMEGAEADLDAALRAGLEEGELPDGGFTERWAARADRHRRRRRTALAVAGLAGSVLAGWAAAMAPSPFLSLEGAQTATLVAALLLTALCVWVWIGTEAGGG